MADKNLNRRIAEAIDEADMVVYRADASDKLDQYLKAAVSENTKLDDGKGTEALQKSLSRPPAMYGQRDGAVLVAFRR